jgi:succinate-acetate transporter protein
MPLLAINLYTWLLTSCPMKACKKAEVNFFLVFLVVTVFILLALIIFNNRVYAGIVDIIQSLRRLG